MTKIRLFVAGLLAALLLAAPAAAMEHTLGFGVGAFPDYEGSDDLRTVPLLMLKGRYDSGRSFSLNGPRLRVDLMPGTRYSLGPVVNYRQGRDDVDNRRVDAMRDIDPHVEAGLQGGIDLDGWQLGAEFLAEVSGEHHGMTSQLSLGYRWRAAPELSLSPRLFTTYADDDYMETFFGVNPGNRGGSGLPDYRPGAGFKDVGLSLVVDYTPWQRWGLSGFLSYTTLIGDAKDSPLVADEGSDRQFSFGLMGTYRWGER